MLLKENVTTPGVTDAGKFEAHELERQNVVYTDGSKRFIEVSRDFSKQYAYIYSARLNTFRNILAPVIKKKWSDSHKVLKLCELHDKGTTCVIIGTLFKIQELKPSILKELSDQLEIIPQAPRTHFVHDSDSLVLEDELQRIKLVGECIDVHQVVTGVVCALLGSEDEDGIFNVKDVCWAGCGIQKPLSQLSSDRYMVLVSGLNTSKTANHMFSMHLFLEWLSGLSGSSEYQEELSKIVRVIVAGGVFANHSTENSVNESDFIESAELVDTFAAAISAVAPLDMMPSSNDPTGIMLPQKPFHYCLFPKATEYKSFNRVSNPYECHVGGLMCLGTSGEPVNDIMRYSKIDNSMEAMRKTLQWRHIAPTCPDTIPCTPCVDTDPFIIYNCPAIYFSGGSTAFATDVYKGMTGKKRSEKEKKERLREQKKAWIRKKREKMTEIELEERRQKDRERYKKKKEAGKIKSIMEYTPRMQKTIRKSWRERAQTHRNKLKRLKATEQRVINDETPPPSPTSQSSTVSSRASFGRRLAKNNKRRLRIENMQMKQRILHLENLLANKRMKLLRARQFRNTCMTVDEPPKTIMTVRYRKQIEKKEEVRKFLEKDEYSRMTSGKKETITRNKQKKQIRLLNDTLLNLYEKFKEETKIKMSYALFCRLRPFWVLVPNANKRNTCLCVIHTNMELMVATLKKAAIIKENSPIALVKRMCCEGHLKIDCLGRQCNLCKNKSIKLNKYPNDMMITCERWITKKIQSQ